MASKRTSVKETRRIIAGLGGTNKAAAYFEMTPEHIRGLAKTGLHSRLHRLVKAEHPELFVQQAK